MAAKIFAAIVPAWIVAASADSVPPRPRQPVPERPEAGDAGEIEEGDIEQEHEPACRRFLAARDESREKELYEDEERKDERDHHQEADEHFLARAGPFETVVDDVRA